MFNFAPHRDWDACQNMCPHKRDMVLARGLIGDQKGTPKVACPRHKKTFLLIEGHNLGGEEYNIKIYLRVSSISGRGRPSLSAAAAR